MIARATHEAGDALAATLRLGAGVRLMSTLPQKTDRALRAAALVLGLSAASEIGVGVLALVLPAVVVQFLVGAQIEGIALMLTRMAGVAITVVGIGWWRERTHLDTARLRRVAPGFLLYNLGIGALFLARALETAGHAIPWIVAVAHFAFAAVMALLLGQLPYRSGDKPEVQPTS